MGNQGTKLTCTNCHSPYDMVPKTEKEIYKTMKDLARNDNYYCLPCLIRKDLAPNSSDICKKCLCRSDTVPTSDKYPKKCSKRQICDQCFEKELDFVVHRTNDPFIMLQPDNHHTHIVCTICHTSCDPKIERCYRWEYQNTFLCHTCYKDKFMEFFPKVFVSDEHKPYIDKWIQNYMHKLDQDVAKDVSPRLRIKTSVVDRGSVRPFSSMTTTKKSHGRKRSMTESDSNLTRGRGFSYCVSQTDLDRLKQ